jgi:drug/metabolite transporter (DMT)-like permease
MRTDRLAGFAFAVISAASFGTSGVLARGLLDAGWSPAAAVTWRVTIGALILALPAARELRGRWHLLRRNWSTIFLFGVISVAGCQLTYFLAVSLLSVAVALLLEYCAVILVVGWAWLRHGQRPGRLTIFGTLVALTGLTLVLGVFGAITVNPMGAFWGLAAACGLAMYFVMSADMTALPPITLAAGGLLVSAAVLGVAGLLGVVDMIWTANDVLLAGVHTPWWISIAILGIVAAALAYLTGVAGARRLGSKMASFISLSEVLFAAAWAWLLLAQAPTELQLLGGVFILTGAVMVKLGDDRGR